jgi:hypothetical protein
MPVHALLGIENAALNTAVSLLLLVLVVLWLALVFWTYKDAVRRVADPWLVVTATATSLIFPFIGTVVYLILRPPEYLEDVRERELEIAAAEARLMHERDHGCPHCGFPVERSFLRCPSCHRRLKQPCATCRKPLDPGWRICPYCEAEVGEAPPPRRRRRVPSGAADRGRAPAAARASGSAPAQRPAQGARRRTAPPPGAPTPPQSPQAPGAAQRPPAGGADGLPADEPTVVRPRPSR